HRGDAVHHRVGRQNRWTDAHDLRHRSAVANQFEDLRGDQRHGFRMIQLETAAAALTRELAGREDEQLVDFPRREVHGGAPEAESYYSLTACAARDDSADAPAMAGAMRRKPAR